MDQGEFKALLQKAIEELFNKDYMILEREFNINEITVSHRLGMFLGHCFLEFDVDCEYNRMANNQRDFTEGDYWAKTLNLSVEGNISGEDDEAKTVFPDIIIHKRKEPINLAVIEVKMKWKNSRKDFDYQKLRAYKVDLKYQFAVYPEFDERNCFIDFV